MTEIGIKRTQTHHVKFSSGPGSATLRSEHKAALKAKYKCGNAHACHQYTMVYCGTKTDGASVALNPTVFVFS